MDGQSHCCGRHVEKEWNTSELFCILKHDCPSLLQMMTYQLVQAAEAHKVHHSLSRVMDLVPVRPNDRRVAAAVAAARVAISSTARHVVKSTKQQRILQQEQQHNMRRISRSAPPTGLHAWRSCPGDASPHSSAIDSIRSASAERRTASWQAVQDLYNEQTEGSQDAPLSPGSFSHSPDQPPDSASNSSAAGDGSTESCRSSRSRDRASTRSCDAKVDTVPREESTTEPSELNPPPRQPSAQSQEDDRAQDDLGIEGPAAHRIDVSCADLDGEVGVVADPETVVENEGVGAGGGHDRCTGDEPRESKEIERYSTSLDGFDISGASVAGFLSGNTLAR